LEIKKMKKVLFGDVMGMEMVMMCIKGLRGKW
jgi:hypothetical protein